MVGSILQAQLLPGYRKSCGSIILLCNNIKKAALLLRQLYIFQKSQLCECTFYFHFVKAFNDIAYTQIVIVFHHQTALVAGVHFFHVVFETFQ